VGTPSGPEVHCETRQQWRDWLRAHCEQPTGVWLLSWRPATGRPAVAYEDAVVEALAVGWIDATAKVLDQDRRAQWFCPRKPGSGWARTNKVRIAALEASGGLHPRGAAVLAAAKADGSWTLLDDVEDLLVPADLAAALAAAGGTEAFAAFPPSARKVLLTWVVQAKRPATRASRIAVIAEHAARGERPPQFR
jgi:uncharacterized protein YdeI (YjbR/CyaY-like superfamily)